MPDVISTADHIKLRDTLAQLYLDRESAMRIASDAGLNLAHLKFSDNAANNWEEITRKAAAWDLLVPLIQHALAEYPTNAELKEVLGAVQAGAETRRPHGRRQRRSLMFNCVISSSSTSRRGTSTTCCSTCRKS